MVHFSHLYLCIISIFRFFDSKENVVYETDGLDAYTFYAFKVAYETNYSSGNMTPTMVFRTKEDGKTAFRLFFPSLKVFEELVADTMLEWSSSNDAACLTVPA